MNKKIKNVPLVVLFSALILTGVGVYALTVQFGSTTYLSFFTGQIVDSEFDVTRIHVKVSGKNHVHVRFDIKNTADVIRNGTVYIQLLDGNGDMIDEHVYEMLNVPVGHQWTKHVDFNKKEIMLKFYEVYVIVTRD